MKREETLWHEPDGAVKFISYKTEAVFCRLKIRTEQDLINLWPRMRSGKIPSCGLKTQKEIKEAAWEKGIDLPWVIEVEWPG